MDCASVNSFVSELRGAGILDPEQLRDVSGQLQPQYVDPHPLAQELIRRGWLTAYQAAYLLRGEGQKLLLGPYLLLERLGEGGMGRVFKARHQFMKRIVALKVLLKGSLPHPDAVERFHREVQAMGQLSHPNIVLAHDAAQIGPTLYLVMEYVDGVDLGRLVKRHGALPIGRACDYIRQAALGLQHAHERGLVHRDVKPTNLLLTRLGHVVKLVDLGIALLERKTTEPAIAAALVPEYAEPTPSRNGELTCSGAVLGTPDYIAPEQAMNPHQADARADIYALGCTFYFLLTGQPPFPTGTQADKLLRQQHEEPPAVEQLRTDLPASVAAVLRRMMAKRPDDRFQTPAEAAQALAPFADVSEASGSLIIDLDGQGHSTLDPREKTHVARPRPGLMRTPLHQLLAVLQRLPSFLGGRRGHAALGVLLGTLLALLVLLPIPPHDDSPTGTASTRHYGIVRSVCFNPDGSLAASGGADNTIRLWDTHSLREWGALGGHGDTVYALAFSKDGRYLISGGGDNTLRQWDVGTGREVRRFLGHTWFVNAVALSPDGLRMVSAGADKTARVWDISSGKELYRFTGHTGPVLSVAFSPDDRHILSADQDQAIWLWEAETGRVIHHFVGHTEAVWSVAFSPDASRIVTGSEDRTLRLWDVKTGREIRRLLGHETAVLCVCYAPCGHRILSGGADGVLRLWDAKTGEELRAFKGHTDWIRSVAVSPDGLRAISGGRDRYVRFWTLPRCCQSK
jgi:serine/threonine protein kinase